MKRAKAFALGLLLAITGGVIAQQSNVGGLSARLRLGSLGVGNAAPAGTGNITASGTVTATNYVGNVGGIEQSDFARLSQANTFLANLVVSGADARSELLETDAAANNKRWHIRAQLERLHFSVVSDAGSDSEFMVVDRTANVIDSIALTATAITANGSAVCTANGTNCPAAASSGNFTVTYDDACSTSPTVTYGYNLVGNLVTLMVKSSTGFPCTSDATTFAGTAVTMPAAIRPTAGNIASVALYQGCTDNGAATPCNLFINTAGNVNLLRLNTVPASISWTNSGNKSGPATGQFFSYYVNNP